MNITEEHTHLRRFLQRLGSNYVYRTGVLSGDYSHQPVRIVVGQQPKEEINNTPPVQGPNALTFALAGEPERPVSPARALAKTLKARGHLLLTKEGKLFVTNSSLLKDEDRTAIKELKPELLLLAMEWPDENQPKSEIKPSTASSWLSQQPDQDTPTSLAVFLGTVPLERNPDWIALPPPENLPHDIVLNFETNGLNWAGDDEPIGVTVGTLDGQLKRYLPFAHRGGGNLDRGAVIRFLQNLRGHHITNANTRFDMHMGHNIGVDFEAQGCTVSDVMHYAALLDDHRKKFSLDVLAKDYLGGIEVERLDERNMADYAASDVAQRAEYQATLVSQLREKMWPELDAQDLQRVRQLEDDVIYPVVEMEKNGSKLDIELTEQYHKECIARHDALMWEVSHEAGFAFEHTAAGWKKLLEHLKLSVPDSFKESVLDQYDHPLVKKAQVAAQYASLDSKTFTPYLKNVDAKGVLRYDINQLRGDDGGTVSGRFSFAYIQQTPNHDNHHKAFGTGEIEDCHGTCDLFPRRLFIGDGCDYLEADANQIEFRLLAHFAKNSDILAAYQEDPYMSFHKKTWAMIKQYKPDLLYSHMKNFNFARQYGAKLVKLSVMMGFITEEQGIEIKAAKRWNDPRLDTVREIEAAYAKIIPEGDALLDEASHLAKSYCDDYCRKGDALHRKFPHRGYVRTLLGRRSRFPNNYKTYIGLNRVLQGTGADIMKRKIVELHRARKTTGFLMRMTNHDAVGGDAWLPETKKMVREILNSQSFPLKVPILWTVGTGANWAQAK